MPFKVNEKGEVVGVVNGQEKSWSQEQFQALVDNAQKVEGANAKFEEAAKLRKDAEGLASSRVDQVNKQVAQYLKQADQGDVASYQKLLEIQGYSGEQLIAKLNAYQEAVEEHQTAQRGGRKTGGGEQQQQQAPVARGPIALKDLDPTLQDILKTYVGEHQERQRQGIYSEGDVALAKDAGFGKIVSEGGARAEKLKAAMQRQIRSRIQDGEEYGPLLLQNAVKELKDFAGELGDWGKPQKESLVSIPGLGPAPGAIGLDAQATTPPVVPSINDPGFSGGILRKLAHEVTNG